MRNGLRSGVFVASLAVAPFAAAQVPVLETEPNNTFATANLISPAQYPTGPRAASTSSPSTFPPAISSR